MYLSINVYSSCCPLRSEQRVIIGPTYLQVDSTFQSEQVNALYGEQKT